ncbi:PREDICTED: inactive protein RESTRICTED TEV MOVEMENT 2-like [Prunus mume]|uniref:Inactive protein RESTRICTED TEV MOVEMENT 2-like n=1 Tax=Prunus mume TaxID=102107 RepID=A0ABM0PHV1_PRUMU|nr:PREDICTED: inactive protein RESTRICTED TEV MOVEMENT 2-like [Prunus mume]
MAQVRGSSTRGMGERSSSSTRLHEKILPSSGWTEDSNGHYLLVDLPDFKKEEVKLVVNVSAGYITVSGQRQVNKKNSEYFEQNFSIPPNSDVDKITGKFDAGILYVTVPKVAAVVEEKKEAEPEIIENQNVEETAATEPAQPENKNVEGAAAENIHLTRPKNDGQHSNKDDGASKKLSGNNDRIFFSLENIRKWEEHEDGILKTAMEMLSKNKGIVITAVVAFSLGVLVSRQTFQ